MSYGEKVNTSSISLQGEFPTIDDPISVATMTSIYQQAKNSSCYNSTKCLSNVYSNVFYNYCLPPMLIFDYVDDGSGSGPLVRSSSSVQQSGIDVFLPTSEFSSMSGLQVDSSSGYMRPRTFSSGGDVEVSKIGESNVR